MKSLSLAILLATSALSCREATRPQVLVVVEAEPGVVTDSSSLELVVRGAAADDDAITQVVFRALLPDGNGNYWGTEVALTPESTDASRRFRVDATAFATTDGTGVPVATVYAISGYVPNEVRVLRLLLRDSCRGVRCEDPETTCGKDGECEDPVIQPEMLLRLDARNASTADPDLGMERDLGVERDFGPEPECRKDIDCYLLDCVVAVCSGGRCERIPDDTACASANPCTVGRCDLIMGCVETPNLGAPCDDGFFCNGPDSCDASGVCQAGTEPRCPSPTNCDEIVDRCDCVNGSCNPGLDCVAGTCVCPGGESTERSCFDNADNDCDQLRDCADSDCNGEACGGNGRTCIAGSCACLGGATETLCANGVDDDCDGLIDCRDDDCESRSCGPNDLTCVTPNCVCINSTGVEICDNMDNNCNGEIDEGDVCG